MGTGTIVYQPETNEPDKPVSPDLRIRLPTSSGPTDSLAELKVISAGVTWFPCTMELYPYGNRRIRPKGVPFENFWFWWCWWMLTKLGDIIEFCMLNSNLTFFWTQQTAQCPKISIMMSISSWFRNNLTKNGIFGSWIKGNGQWLRHELWA